MDDALGSPELDQLIACLVDGQATSDDIAVLERLLDGNPDAQRRYIHYLDLHAELVQRSSALDADLSDVRRQRLSFSKQRIRIVALLAATILIAVGMGIGRQMSPPPGESRSARRSDDNPTLAANPEPTDDGVAVLKHAVDVKWLGSNTPELGEILSSGELRLGEGLIQIEFYSGVELIVEGPAELEIVSVASVICRQGKLRSLVPPNATGFSVLTPKFELVDLGTEFAINVTDDGRSDVHVFEGEVELYSPDGKRKPEQKQILVSGSAMGWSNSGDKTSIQAEPAAFVSFEDVRARDVVASERRYRNWKQWSESLNDDATIVARYHLESDGSTLIDTSATEAHGTIVGCEWTAGRWPGKHALEFKRPGDRVRIDVPGEFNAFTVMAWVRVDALPMRRQSLLLTDGYELGRLHWQIGSGGELRVGSRIPPQGRRIGTGYASPSVFTPRQVGVWTCVCSTYDRSSRKVTHCFNGKQVFSETLEIDQPIRIGMAEIGNWGVPHRPKRHAVRNFIGRMDELTIWNVALSEQQIADIYENSHP